MTEKDGITILIEKKWMIVAAILLLLILLIFGYIVLPLLDGIILGLVFAYIGRPIKKGLEKRGLRESGAALVATVTIITPLIGILGLGMIEIFSQLLNIARNQQQLINTLTDYINALDIPEPVYVQMRDVIFNLSSTVLPMLGQIPFSIGMKVALFILNVIISVFVCFFLLMDGTRFVNAILNMIPGDKQPLAESFRNHLDYILAGIFLGNIYAAMITSILSIVVFYYFNVPHILAMSALILIAGLIPIFAGWMVLLPIAFFRYVNLGSESAVVFIIVSAIILYAPTELFFKPYIIGKVSRTHPLLIMLAFIGGGLVGGIGGFFMAPIFLGTLMAAYRAYMEFGFKKDEIFNVEGN